MASTFLPQFSDTESLRRFSFPLLYQFLLPYRDYLCDKINLRWTDCPDRFPYSQLVRFLALPDDDMPDMLRSGLFFIDALSSPEGTNRLAETLHYEGLLPAFPLTHNDCALYAWMADPGLAQSLHSQIAADASQQTEPFYCRKASHPDLSRERVIALEDDLNDWFPPSSAYSGIQLAYHYNRQTVGFQVRFGEILQQAAPLNDTVKRVVPRPERYVFLSYSPETRCLEVFSKELKEADVFATLWGKHLFGDMNHFFPDETNHRYTLAPLRERGRDILTCGDVDRLNHVALAELDIVMPGNHGQTLHSDTCLFGDENYLLPYLKACTAINQATFLMHVAGLPGPRKLTIRTPGTSIFHREGSVDMIYSQWLRKRKLAN
jgi:hypothetical protein